MKDLHLATLFTDVLEDHRKGLVPETGRFEIEVYVNEKAMLKSGDPRGYAFKEIGIHLQQAILDTTVPKEFWYAKFPAKVCRAFNLPGGVSFDPNKVFRG